MTARPLRVLNFAPDGFPTHRADVSVLFGAALPERGVHSDLVTSAASEGPIDNLPSWPGGERLVCERSSGRIGNLLRTFMHNLRALRAARRGYDAIQVRDMAFFAVPALRRARRLGLPFFFWMSYPMSEASIDLARTNGLRLGFVRLLFVAAKGYAGKWLLYSYVLPRADHVFVQSDRMRDDVAAMGIPSDKMTPVPMGADMRRIDRLPIAPSDDPRLAGKRVLVYLGTLQRNRRIDFMFEVLQKLLPRYPNLLLVLAGEAAEEADQELLRQQASALGVDQAVLKTGWLPTDEAWRYLKAAEIGLSPFPSGFLHDSTSPTKAIEYLALGIPAVVNDHPDQAKVIGESGAGICVPYAVDAFAGAVASILDDPALAAGMRERGPAYVRARRSYDALGDLVAAEYRRLIDSGWEGRGHASAG